MSYIINDVIHYIKQCIHETEVLTIMKGDVIPYEKVPQGTFQDFSLQNYYKNGL